ncbi:hypothetical protein ACERII_20390 [Evansella sp. AB-rgal1]|uniref:hypothetical protein n=1 Tax=Evansella sp. AB-rgal1 TaxID=3242696 RepID=UPI00359D128F
MNKKIVKQEKDPLVDKRLKALKILKEWELHEKNSREEQEGTEVKGKHHEEV